MQAYTALVLLSGSVVSWLLLPPNQRLHGLHQQYSVKSASKLHGPGQ